MATKVFNNEQNAINAVKNENYVYEVLDELSGTFTEIKNPIKWSEQSQSANVPVWY